MMSLYHTVSFRCSKQITEQYSTSFSGAIKLLHKDLRAPVYNIYGFVRLADEIVDTFHAYNKAELLEKFEQDTWDAIKSGISLNPVLHSFQSVVNQYNIPHHLIRSFLHSMKMDLYKTAYVNELELDEYIYGSAEVVGLMCLYVFCEGNAAQYESLKDYARRLGAAFQKINFLRDIRADVLGLSRSYFPGVNFHDFTDAAKMQIAASIEDDFRAGLEGIRKLPWKAKMGVYTAYRYYYKLHLKIKAMKPAAILQKRVRVPDLQKLLIILQAGMYNKLNWI